MAPTASAETTMPAMARPAPSRPESDRSAGFLANAEFMARHLKPYGMEWVQIDDGYQQTFGDWQGNHLYPHGMQWLATQIRRLGLKPGIWIAPYAIAEPEGTPLRDAFLRFLETVE